MFEASYWHISIGFGHQIDRIWLTNWQRNTACDQAFSASHSKTSKSAGDENIKGGA